MTDIANFEQMSVSPNIWVDHESGMIYVGRDGQSIQSMLDEAAMPYASPAPTIDDYRLAISSMMDEAAQSKQYDNAVSIATYVGSTNTQWAAEAQAFVAWRDEIWAYSYAELDKVQAGERAQPSVADFLAELQTTFPLTWPATA